MKLQKTIVALGVACALGTLASANATPFAEIGDAGETLGTAQAVTGGTNSITGSLTASNADLFSFSWLGGLFNARTYSPIASGAVSDPQLFLFNSAGNLVVGNDDFSGLQADISATLAAGSYFLGISSFNNDPRNGSGANMCGGNCGTFATASGPLASWSGGGGSGNYIITLNDSTTSSVPEPASLALLGIGLAGLGFARRKKQQAA